MARPNPAGADRQPGTWTPDGGAAAMRRGRARTRGRPLTGTDTELVAVALAAMLSPTTLSFSIFALVLGDRPLRTGVLFYAGALGATLAVGVAAAFVLGDIAASGPSTPKHWVGWVDVALGSLALVYVFRALRRPRDPRKEEAMMTRMSKVASSPAVAVVGAGAALANPGAFIPIALKTISQSDPSPAGYIAQWVAFSVVSLLPLALAIVLLLVARTGRPARYGACKAGSSAMPATSPPCIVVLLAAALLRNGITILT